MNKFVLVYRRLFSAFGKQGWWPVCSANPALEVCLGAILTQNTAWKNVEKAIGNLNRAGLISVGGMLSANTKQLALLIKPSGYYNQKAKKLKNLCRFLAKVYSGDAKMMRMENAGVLREKLLKINGVGEETADSILLYAANKPCFVVDAYTRRIFSRLKLISGNENYKEIKKLFEGNLPEDAELFGEYHALIVRLGKDFCRKKPLCRECPLSGLCRKGI